MFLSLFLLLFALPLALHAAWWFMRDDLAPNWSRADWSSAKLLPAAEEAPEASVHIYAARVGRWRGVFAHHSWIVLKEKGSRRYARYDKVGWGQPVRVNGWVADGRWFGNVPELVLEVKGEAAERLIPRLRDAVDRYPYRNGGDYRAWPGPNSNSFVAFVVSQVPELAVALPPTAIGKDWRGAWYAGPTPSRTGIQAVLGGMFGLTLGWVEGFEVNVLGLVTGFDIRRPALKLPGFGRVGMGAAGML